MRNQKVKSAVLPLLLFIFFIAINYPLIHFYSIGWSGYIVSINAVRIYFGVLMLFALFCLLNPGYKAFIFFYSLVLIADLILTASLYFYQREIMMGWDDSHRVLGIGGRPTLSSFIHFLFLYFTIFYIKKPTTFLLIYNVLSLLLIFFAFKSGLGYVLIFGLLLLSIKKFYFKNAFLYHCCTFLFLFFVVINYDSLTGEYEKLNIDYLNYLLSLKVEAINDAALEIDKFSFLFGFNKGEYSFGGDFGLANEFINLGIILFVFKYVLMLYVGMRSDIFLVALAIISSLHYSITSEYVVSFVFALILYQIFQNKSVNE
jgi:hypothetical protein